MKGFIIFLVFSLLFIQITFAFPIASISRWGDASSHGILIREKFDEDFLAKRNIESAEDVEREVLPHLENAQRLAKMMDEFPDTSEEWRRLEKEKTAEAKKGLDILSFAFDNFPDVSKTLKGIWLGYQSDLDDILRAFDDII
jgi:hypothetical protein